MDLSERRHFDSISQRYEESKWLLKQPELPELVYKQLDDPSRGELTGQPQACRQGRKEAAQQEIFQTPIQAVLPEQQPGTSSLLDSTWVAIKLHTDTFCFEWLLPVTADAQS